MLKRLYYLSRYLLAGLFIFSGMIKCLDPMGTEIKLGEYLAAFSLDFLGFSAAGLSVVLSSLELMLGLMLLVGAFKRFAAIAVALFMAFFTVLTLVIALTNPVSDCGCFGDVIVLSNSATFYKNCIFDVFVLFLLCYTFKQPKAKGAFRWYHPVVWGAVVLIPVYSYLFLPAIEVLPFKVGTDINRAVIHAVGEVQEVVLLYRNKATGQIERFSLEDPEWQDETKWEFVSTQDEDPGTKINVVSFDLLDKSGNEISELLLSSPDTTVLLVAKESRAVVDNNRLKHLVAFAQQNDFPVMLVTASEIDLTESLLSDLAPIEVYNMDETTIKTLLRAPAGAVVLSSGVVLGKWNAKTLPRFDTQEEFENRLADQQRKPLWFALFVAVAILPLLVVHLKRRKK